MITALFRTRLLAMVVLGMLVASGPAFAQTDYDTDNDNLIDVTTLEQLNAIRWDLHGRQLDIPPSLDQVLNGPYSLKARGPDHFDA